MKKKFETNVAAELPKTRMSQEPGLPWKVTASDLEEVVSAEEEYKSVVTGTPPLRTRAIFPALLLVVVFAAMLYFSSKIAVDNEKARSDINEKELAMLSLQQSLEKINAQNAILNENAAALDRRLRDLNAQKELFTTVIESLTKKADEAPPEYEKNEKSPANN